MQNNNFLGICILISIIILSSAIFYHAKQTKDIGRFQFQPSDPPGVIWVIDTTTGEVKTN